MADERSEDEKVQSLIELFSGRFLRNEFRILLRHCDGACNETAYMILSGDHTELRDIIGESEDNWSIVPSRQRLRLSAPAWDRAKNGHIETKARLFACHDCDNVWWRKVPGRKQVSKCFRCHNKFEPVPRNQEWGWAEFHCTSCGHEFRGFGAMGVPSPCYSCRAAVQPTEIHPPTRAISDRARPRNQHSCYAPDCFNRAPGPPVHGTRCVHPQSLRRNHLPKVIVPSSIHISSGSTVATFLPQDDLLENYDVFSTTLSDIPSEGEESGEGSGHDGD